MENPVLVVLGDYIDRGPQSAGVIDRIIALAQSRDVVALRGNHEDMLLKVMGNFPHYYERWAYRCGGVETLSSYGWKKGQPVNFAELIPAAHIEFLKSLKIILQTADYIFVHAGLKQDVALSDRKSDV